MAKIKVAVLFGGVSNEHDISLISAGNIISGLSPEKYEVIPVGITKKGRWLSYPGDVSLIANGEWETHPDCVPASILPDTAYKGIVKIINGEATVDKIDVVIPAIHGRTGEDGKIQGLLDMSGIPYVGCGCLSSAICFDKVVTHTMLEYKNIRMAKWRLINHSDLGSLDIACERAEQELSYPIFVKPANSGSSVGASKADNRDELKNAVKLAFSHDKRVIAEEYIKGREVECAIFGGEKPVASDIGEIISCNEFYDYEAKYIKNSSEIKIPANVEPETAAKIRDIAIRAFKILGCQGLARVDFFLKDNDEIILNEINTFPGFTNISMYPKLMELAGYSLPELLDNLIELTIDN